MIAVDLSEQPAIDADPKAIQQINFTGSIGQNANIKCFSSLKCKRNCFVFSTRNRESIVNYFTWM